MEKKFIRREAASNSTSCVQVPIGCRIASNSLNDSDSLKASASLKALDFLKASDSEVQSDRLSNQENCKSDFFVGTLRELASAKRRPDLRWWHYRRSFLRFQQNRIAT